MWLHSQISHQLSKKNYTHVPLCQRAHSLDCCCAPVKTCRWAASGIQSSGAGTTAQAALSPRLQKLHVHPPDLPALALSSQSSCMLKTSLLRSKVVNEEAGRREDPHFGMA